MKADTPRSLILLGDRLLLFTAMDTDQLLEDIKLEYGVSDISNLSDGERWQIYERLKQSAQNRFLSADSYTKEIIRLAELLEL